MFTSKDSAGQSIGLIPDKTSAKAVVTIRGIKTSQNTGGRYLDLEFTVVGGEFNGRKVWSVVMDPSFEGNTPEAKSLGKKFIVRMLEAAGLVTVGDEASYGRFASLQDVVNALNGQTVAIKIGIKKGTDGRADKNSVSDYYSPNPESGYAEKFQQVMSGAGSASANQTPTLSSKPSFLSTPKNGNPF
jgi:hypothetical protein